MHPIFYIFTCKNTRPCFSLGVSEWKNYTRSGSFKVKKSKQNKKNFCNYS